MLLSLWITPRPWRMSARARRLSTPPPRAPERAGPSRRAATLLENGMPSTQTLVFPAPTGRCWMLHRAASMSALERSTDSAAASSAQHLDDDQRRARGRLRRTRDHPRHELPLERKALRATPGAGARSRSSGSGSPLRRSPFRRLSLSPFSHVLGRALARLAGTSGDESDGERRQHGRARPIVVVTPYKAASDASPERRARPRRRDTRPHGAVAGERGSARRPLRADATRIRSRARVSDEIRDDV